jgi:hypothetical protein
MGVHTEYSIIRIIGAVPTGILGNPDYGSGVSLMLDNPDYGSGAIRNAR